MKPFLLNLLLLVLLPNCIWGQLPYTPFPDSNALWSNCPTLKYYMEGDTTINQKIYKKIFTSNDSIFLKENMEYLFALREDMNKKIYGVKNGEETEKLLYDFSLNIGDTASVYTDLLSYPINILIINEDSLQMIDGSFRRTLLVGSENGDFTFTWIEGIGSTINLLWPYIDYIYETCDILLCFEENDIEIHHPSFPYTNNCHYEAGSGTYFETIPLTQNIHFFPNPIRVSQILNLEIDFIHNLETAQVAIYSSTGKVKKEYTLHESPFRLKIPELPTGIYYLNISNNQGLYFAAPLLIND